jgi:mono/diheme cytochrome c family protein
MTIIKSAIPALFAAAAILCAASVNPGKGNEGKGKYYFKQTCKECHTKGAKGGEVSPLTRTMAQWHTYFVKGKHAGGSEPLTKFMTAEQLKDVGTFLFNHAADSLQPETCGK